MHELTPGSPYEITAAPGVQIYRTDTATYCAYCGARFPLDDQAASLVTEHIYTCEKHPMRTHEMQREELLTELELYLTQHKGASPTNTPCVCFICDRARAAIANAKGA